MLSIVRQAQLLDLLRSSVYYLPQATPEAQLALMRRIDELHLKHLFAGARMLRDLLRHEGHSIGRKHVATLMRRMGIGAVSEGEHQPVPCCASGLFLSAAWADHRHGVMRTHRGRGP